MTDPRATRKFRLAAAALGGASRAEPSFPPEVHDSPIAVWVSTRPVESAAADDSAGTLVQALAAVREAFVKERAVFRIVDTEDEADVVMTILRAYRQPSLDFWDTAHAHASLVVRRTGLVLDAGSDYVEARNWGGVGSTLVFLAKLQCAEHYEAIARHRVPRDAPALSPALLEGAGHSDAKPLDVEPSMLSDERLRGVLARLRARLKGGRR